MGTTFLDVGCLKMFQFKDMLIIICKLVYIMFHTKTVAVFLIPNREHDEFPLSTETCQEYYLDSAQGACNV